MLLSNELSEEVNILKYSPGLSDVREFRDLDAKIFFNSRNLTKIYVVFFKLALFSPFSGEIGDFLENMLKDIAKILQGIRLILIEFRNMSVESGQNLAVKFE